MNYTYIVIFVFLFVLSPFKSWGQQHPVINEIMANPSNGSLPNQEWVEIYNPTDVSIHLSSYTYSYNNRLIPMPDLFLGAKQFIILTAENYKPLFEPFGNVIGFSSWPVLANSGATLRLIHENEGIVDEVSYKNQWHKSTQKRNGGWSLERINSGFSCNMLDNWSSSEALPGGTPGRKNSIADAFFIPDVNINHVLFENKSLKIVFNQNLTDQIHVSSDNLHVKPSLGSLISYDYHQDTLILVFDYAVELNTPYHIDIAGQFCAHDFKIAHSFFKGDIAVFNDVVINEILFHPKPSGVDFVELYNRSNKTINLQGWRLGNRLLTKEMRLFEPQTYMLITVNPGTIKDHYPSAILDNCINLPSLPSYANQRGVVTIFDKENRLIDSLRYDASMHHPFISNAQGISLERKSADVPTNAFGAFISAATLSEGATPGYENSKNIDKQLQKNNFFLKSKTFSPDHDHVEDLLVISYDLIVENWMLNLTIFDDQGREINRLIRNKSIGMMGEITWDGRTEFNKEASSGTYIFFAEIYNDKGVREVFKESFVLVRKGQGY